MLLSSSPPRDNRYRHPLCAFGLPGSLLLLHLATLSPSPGLAFPMIRSLGSQAPQLETLSRIYCTARVQAIEMSSPAAAPVQPPPLEPVVAPAPAPSSRGPSPLLNIEVEGSSSAPSEPFSDPPNGTPTLSASPDDPVRFELAPCPLRSASRHASARPDAKDKLQQVQLETEAAVPESTPAIVRAKCSQVSCASSVPSPVPGRRLGLTSRS